MSPGPLSSRYRTAFVTGASTGLGLAFTEMLLAEGVEVTPETLFGAGLVRRPDHPIKLLGTGEVSGRKFVVKGVAVSASARTKIEQAGGTIA